MPACILFDFNPRTHRGVRQIKTWLIFSNMIIFQSTHPSWGATQTINRLYIRIVISIHAPIVGCDMGTKIIEVYLIISIHAPIVGCDIVFRRLKMRGKISIHAPIVGCDRSEVLLDLMQLISIHAPIVGCDWIASTFDILQEIISIHAPIVGCDKIYIAQMQLEKEFQSTHPSWGATE